MPRESGPLLFPANELKAMFQWVAEKAQDGALYEVADDTEVVAVPQQIGHHVFLLGHPDLTL